jgi:hypothetical protein
MDYVTNSTQGVIFTIEGGMRLSTWNPSINKQTGENITRAIYSYLGSPIATPTSTCTCPGAGVDWKVNLADNCIIEANCNCATLSFYGDGSFWINSAVTVDTNGNIYTQNVTTGDTIWIQGTGAIT